MSQNSSVAASEAPTQIDCLLVPLKEKTLLVPNVAIAEIVPFSHLLTTTSSAEWMIGRVDWRGVSIPVICYEMLCHQKVPAPNPNARFAIINGVGGNELLSFYGLLIQGIPRLTRVKDKALQVVEAMNAGAYDQVAVTVDGENAIIPDLELVEQELIKHM